MNSFHPNYLKKIKFQPGTTWLFGQCLEARGKQDLWLKVKPQVLETLRQTAIVQSTESSNRIEGVEMDKTRLLPLLTGKIKPTDRPEEEILGYKEALSWIHENHSEAKIEPDTIMRLHKIAQSGSVGDAGKWKERDNEIIAILPNGERKIRFKPVSAKKTSHSIDQLCLAFRNEMDQGHYPDLILIASFVFDFLCIHPFRDGNGRVSRLLTLLLLYQNGYQVGKYISLEKLVEETKDDYYEALRKSSSRWHEIKHDSLSWWNYFLSILRRAYNELEERVDLSEAKDQKSQIVRQLVLNQTGVFSLSQIKQLLPTTSEQLIKKVLSELKREGRVSLNGQGRGAKWKLRRSKKVQK